MFRPTTAAALSLRVAIMRTPHRPWLPRRLLHVCAVRQDYELHRRASSRVHTVAQMLRGRPRDLCWHQVSLGRGMASSTNPDSKEHDTTANELQVPELESFETPFDYFDMAVSFDVDIVQLRQRYHVLQSQFHPDKFARAGVVGWLAAVTSAFAR